MEIILDIMILGYSCRKWHRYPALNGFQKAKSIQCYIRQIMSNLGQRKQISIKKRVIGELTYSVPNRTFVQEYGTKEIYTFFAA